MKKFIISSGKIIIDLSAWIFMVVLVGGFLFAVVDLADTNNNLTFTFYSYKILAFFGAFVLFVALYFMFYLFIDMRDKLKEISEKLNEIAANLEEKK